MAIGGYTRIVTDGLVFGIDALNIKSYISGDTTVTDLTGLNPDTTLTNGVGFDGTSFTADGANQYMTCDINDLSPPFTVMVNHKYNSLVNFDTIVTSDSAIVSGSFQIDTFDGDMMFRNTTMNAILYPTTTEPTNLTLSIDVSNNAESYKDGESTSSFVASGSSVFKIVRIFRNRNGTAHSHADVSNFLLYNRVLTPTEIKQNYDATKWRFQ